MPVRLKLDGTFTVKIINYYIYYIILNKNRDIKTKNLLKNDVKKIIVKNVKIALKSMKNVYFNARLHRRSKYKKIYKKYEITNVNVLEAPKAHMTWPADFFHSTINFPVGFFDPHN